MPLTPPQTSRLTRPEAVPSALDTAHPPRAGERLSLADTRETVARVIACSGRTLAASGSYSVTGQPAKRFEKEIIKPGTYTHPSTGMEFTIDAAWIDNAIFQFARMAENGVSVPVMNGHSFNADDTRGRTTRLFRKEGSLWAEAEMIGDDAIAAAARNDTSLYADPEFTDSKKNSYPWAIQHIALTPVPVIRGTQGFAEVKGIAASHGTPSTAPVFRLAQENRMSIARSIALAMGLTLAEDMPEDKIGEAVIAKINADKATKPEDVEAIKASHATEKARADGLALELATVKNPAKPDATTLSTARENRELKLSRLLDSGILTKDVHDGLIGMFVGADGLALAATIDTANDQRFRQLLDVIGKLPKVRDIDSQLTAGQGLKLANDREADAWNKHIDPDIAARKAAAGIK